MAMKLLYTEHLGGTSFDLHFQINNLGKNNHIDPHVFDVHGLAQMAFYIRNTTNNQAEVLLSVWKHDLTMMANVEMTIFCQNPKFEHTLSLSETWTQHFTLFKSPFSKLLKFTIEADIRIGSCKAVLDIMYLDKDFTDFQLSSIEGSVSVHRACLAAHSDVLRRMLCGEWKETAAGCIEIEGVTLKTLQDLKSYMYLGTLPEDGLCPLLRIAAYYLIDDLKAECIIKLAHSVTSENLYDLLEFSYANNVPELTFAILRAVRAQPRDVIEVAHRIMITPKSEDVNGRNEIIGESKDSNEETGNVRVGLRGLYTITNLFYIFFFRNTESRVSTFYFMLLSSLFFSIVIQNLRFTIMQMEQNHDITFLVWGPPLIFNVVLFLLLIVVAAIKIHTLCKFKVSVCYRGLRYTAR